MGTTGPQRVRPVRMAPVVLVPFEDVAVTTKVTVPEV